MPEDEEPSGVPGEESISESPAEQAAPAAEPGQELTEEPAETAETEFELHPEPGQEMEFDSFPARLSDDEPIRLPGNRRRRRQNPLITRPDANELGERLESMARRAAPTFDFFFFSLLAGVIIAIGYMLDAPAVLLFGVLVAPLMAPWTGVALAAATGEIRFLGQTLGGFLTALFLVFISGVLAGLLIRIWMPVTTDQAFSHARLFQFDLLLMAIGSVALTLAFVQSEEKPLLASLMVAYEIFLPVSASGFGLGSGIPGLWLQGLVVLLVHLAISILLALIVLYYMGFRPLEISGYALAGLVVVVLAVVAGYGSIMLENVRGNRPAAPPVATSLTPVLSPGPQVTLSPRATLPPSPTRLLITATPGLTPSPTSLPTPVYGRIRSQGDGAVIRVDPNGTPITTVQNDYLVEILPDPPVTESGAIWVRVKVKTSSRDIVGWVQLNLIVTATPSGPPTPVPTATVRAASP